MKSASREEQTDEEKESLGGEHGESLEGSESGFKVFCADQGDRILVPPTMRPFSGLRSGQVRENGLLHVGGGCSGSVTDEVGSAELPSQGGKVRLIHGVAGTMRNYLTASRA